MKIRFSIAVPAYCEYNINKLLRILLKQKLPKNMILEKIVVAATGYENFHFLKNSKIKIVEEAVRRGKASAINNIIEHVVGDIIVFVDGDNLIKKNGIQKILEPFNSKIGATTGRPMPLKKAKLTNALFRFIWELHHEVSLHHPKICGQFYAIRKDLIEKLPFNIIVDDAYIDYIVRKKSFYIKYIPTALSYIKAPVNAFEIIKWRRRIIRGYMQLGSLNIWGGFPTGLMLKAYLKNSYRLPLSILALMIEFIAILFAKFDTYRNYTPYSWEKCKTE